ncbi:MAG: cytochrome c3 family protein [Gammaproteobacteria bacterium]
MDILLRQQVTRADGIEEFHESEVEGERITLGSDPANNIQIRGSGVERQHAVLQSGNKLVASAPVEYNGKKTKKATLTTGDTVVIGGNSIQVLEAPGGFDMALQISIAEVDEAALSSQYTTEIADVLLSKRKAAWTGFIAVLALCFIVPLVVSMMSDTTELPTAVTDRIWTSGPLHPGHELSSEGDCKVCHQVPFMMVKDEACVDCHLETQSHISTGFHAFDEGNGERCGACHREHDGPDFLVETQMGLCTDCHVDPVEATPGDVTYLAVKGFAESTHPPFRLSMPKASTEDAILDRWELVSALHGDAEDDSKLVFPHDYHLDSEKVEVGAEGRGMVCADCHIAKEDGEHFQPIVMEEQCASCHKLTFDKTDANRLLPHTEAREVIRVMEGHFIRDALEPTDDGFTSYRWRRIPDREDREYGCKKTPLECARETLVAEVELRFEMPANTCAADDPGCVPPTAGGCLECHQVVKNPDKVLEDRYQVVPAKLPDDFYPSQRFDHFSHGVMEGQTGDAACLVCHTADISAKSTDLLIPDVDNCLSCHGDSSVPAIVESTCVDCHRFHPIRKPVLTDLGISDES